MTTCSSGRWWARVAPCLAHRLHPKLLAAPERVFINIAVALVGLSGFFARPGTALDRWPDWIQYEWSVSMIVGGLATLHGYWFDYSPSERMGASLVAIGSAMYGFQFIAAYGARGIIPALMFFGIACAKVLRLIRSAAITSRALELAQQQWEAPDGDGR